MRQQACKVRSRRVRAIREVTYAGTGSVRNRGAQGPYSSEVRVARRQGTHQHESVIGLRQEAGNFPLRIGWFNAVAELSQGLGELPVRRRHGDAGELVDQRFS